MTPETEIQHLLVDDQDPSPSIMQKFYQPVMVLGEGSFSTVIKAYDTLSKQIVAIKIIDKSTLRNYQVQMLIKEAEILNSLSHPNIVKMKFFNETKSKFYIVMELIEGTTLQQYSKMNYTVETVVTITKQILIALKYLHYKDIVHRDIKPENILISQRDQSVHVTLIDFGLSTSVASEQRLQNDNCGTMLYMAPEIIMKKDYNRSIDIWALGIVVYRLLTNGEHPFYSHEDTKQSYQNKLINPTWREQSIPIDKIAKNFLERTIQLHSERRLTADQCLHHPWILGTGDIRDPLTLTDMLMNYTMVQTLSKYIKSSFFISYLKQNSIKKVVKQAQQIQYVEQVEQGEQIENNEIDDQIECYNLKIPRHYDFLRNRSKKSFQLTPQNRRLKSNSSADEQSHNVTYVLSKTTDIGLMPPKRKSSSLTSKTGPMKIPSVNQNLKLLSSRINSGRQSVEALPEIHAQHKKPPLLKRGTQNNPFNNPLQKSPPSNFPKSSTPPRFQ